MQNLAIFSTLRRLLTNNRWLSKRGNIVFRNTYLHTKFDGSEATDNFVRLFFQHLGKTQSRTLAHTQVTFPTQTRRTNSTPAALRTYDSSTVLTRDSQLKYQTKDSRHFLAKNSRQGGSTLILLVMLLCLASASFFMTIFKDESRLNLDILETNVQLAEAREALLGYALQHGRLPRPAVSAIDGRESPTHCTSDNECNGFLPWVTLGVRATDSWGKLLRYSVTAEFTRRPISTVSAIAKKTILRRDSVGRLYFLAGQRGCDALTSCSPAVIFSNGKNNLGTNAQGIRQVNAISGNDDELFNDKTNDTFIQRPLQEDSNSPGGSFDDLLTWISLQALYQRMAVARAL